MPLDRDQHRALDEIVVRARRMYRTALKMQTDHVLPSDKLADLYVDSQVAATYTEMLWRQSGERAREAHAGLVQAPPPQPPTEALQEEPEDAPA